MEKSSTIRLTQAERDQLDQGILPGRLSEEWYFDSVSEVLAAIAAGQVALPEE